MARVFVLALQYYESIAIGIAILFLKICIGIGNTFYRVYWYLYRQYFLMVLLTTLVSNKFATYTNNSLKEHQRD